MPNTNVYLHERIKIRGPHRADYMDHMAKFAPTSREERSLLCVGIWGVVNSTDSDIWPEVVNLWEFTKGWPGVAANFRHEYSHPTLQDDSLRPWWTQATEYRLGGHSRLMVPSSYTPTLEQLLGDQVRGPVYYHQVFDTVPGAGRTLVDLIGEHWLPHAADYGQRLVGVYRTTMGSDNEVIALWAFDDWDPWADFEARVEARDTAIVRFEDRIKPLITNHKAKLLAPSVHTPLNTGIIL